MNVLDVEQYRARRSDVASAFFAFLHFGFVYTPVYLAAWIGPHPAVLLLWLWFGVMQNGIINLLHESAHGLSFASQARSRFLGRWVLGPLVLADFDVYRERHWQHHRRLGQSDDPKVVYHEDIRGKRLFWLFLRCISMVEGVRLLKSGGKGSTPRAKADVLAGLARVALVHSIFLATLSLTALLSHRGDLLLAALSVVIAYGFVYGHGLGGLTVFMAALRAIAEHQIGPEGSATEGTAAMRNFHCNFVSRLVFGAYGFAEHATHHLEPSIPHYNLPAATDALGRTEPVFQRRSSYTSTLRVLWAAEDGAPTVASDTALRPE